MKKIFTIKRLTFDGCSIIAAGKAFSKIQCGIRETLRDKGFDCYQGGGIRQTLEYGIGKENEYSG